MNGKDQRIREAMEWGRKKVGLRSLLRTDIWAFRCHPKSDVSQNKSQWSCLRNRRRATYDGSRKKENKFKKECR